MIVQATDTLTGLSNGEHSLIVYAEDMDGNTGSSETIYFTIAQETESPPQPSDFQDSSLPTEYGYATIAIAVAVMAAAIGFVYLRRKK